MVLTRRLLSVLGLLVVFGVPAVAQGILDPTGDSDAGAGPPWLDYTMLYYEQQGESLYVAITFDGPISSKGQTHSGNTFFNDYDDITTTGQQGTRVGSETNLTFCEWDADGLWMMRVYGLWETQVNGFIYRSVMPVQISQDGKTMSYKHSLVGLNLQDVSFDVNGYYLEGFIWTDPYHFGDQTENVGLYSFTPSLVTPLATVEGANSTLKVPNPYLARANSENIVGALDEIVTLVQSTIGSINPTKKYTVTYNSYSDYPVFVYNAAPNNTFTTFIPGKDWVDEPDWWAMIEGAVYQTMAELNAGYREILYTLMATDVPLPGTTDGWFETHDDSTHGLLWFINHKPTFKALIGRAYHNLVSIYVGEMLTHTDARAAAVAARTQAANAYASFSGNASDLDPWIMTGFLLDKLGSDLSWTMTLWDALPATFVEGDSFGQLVKPFLQDGMSWNNSYATRKYWYQNIASVQAAAIDVATGQDTYTQLKAITGYPTVDSVYSKARDVFQELTGVVEGPGEVVKEFFLSQNYPNPFNPSTRFSFGIPERSHVIVKVYNLLGHELVTLLNQTLDAGLHEVTWNADGMSSGIYFYRVQGGRYSMMKKAVLLK